MSGELKELVRDIACRLEHELHVLMMPNSHCYHMAEAKCMYMPRVCLVLVSTDGKVARTRFNSNVQNQAKDT